MMRWQEIKTLPRDYEDYFLGLHADGDFNKCTMYRGKIYVVNNGDYRDGGHGRDYLTKENYEHSDYDVLTHWMRIKKEA